MNSRSGLDISTSDSDSETTKSVEWGGDTDPSLFYQEGLKLEFSAPQKPATHTLVKVQVKDVLRVEKGKCSQLVLVVVERSSMKSLPRNTHLVAKIYDSLYISPKEIVESGFQDRAALLNYCAENEYRAYSRLKSIQGRLVPRCYGLFTLFFPDRPQSLDHCINVLLLQNVGTPPPDSLLLGPATKGRMVQSMRSAFKQVHSCNILHGDPALRNVVFNKSGKAFLIDFEKARFLEDMSATEREMYIRWENRSFDNQLEYYDFIPAKTPWLAELYMHSREQDRGSSFVFSFTDI
jgi:hypothetical protein